MLIKEKVSCLHLSLFLLSKKINVHTIYNTFHQTTRISQSCPHSVLSYGFCVKEKKNGTRIGQLKEKKKIGYMKTWTATIIKKEQFFFFFLRLWSRQHDIIF